MRLAHAHGPVAVASGLTLPVYDKSQDVVYIQHVLHHLGDVTRALREVVRVLRPGGYLFLVETVEDNPLIRLGRNVYPRWLGDPVTARFTYSELLALVAQSGLQVLEAQTYSVLFWLWEILPDRFPRLEFVTPLFTVFERALARFAPRFGAHCYLIAQSVHQ